MSEINALTLDSIIYSQNQTTQQTCLVIPLNPVIMILEENHKKRGGFGSLSKRSRRALVDYFFFLNSF